jgi:hypothetical protein
MRVVDLTDDDGHRAVSRRQSNRSRAPAGIP